MEDAGWSKASKVASRGKTQRAYLERVATRRLGFDSIIRRPQFQRLKSRKNGIGNKIGSNQGIQRYVKRKIDHFKYEIRSQPDAICEWSAMVSFSTDFWKKKII